MKYNKLSISILLFAVVGITLASCDLLKEKDRTYQGPPQVEFFPLTATVDTTSQVNVQIQLIGHQMDTALPISFNVVDSTSTLSASDYSFGTPSPVSIAPNSSSVTVTINVTDNVPPGESRILDVALQGNTDMGVEAGKNIKTLHITVRGQ